MTPRDSTDGGDAFDLARFLAGQKDTYAAALRELGQGRKRTHWMWFVFPQFAGLGASSTSQYYAIRSLDEARAYLAHPVLGPRLRECAEALLGLVGHSAPDIFGHPDDMKLRSSMTLFALVAEDDSPFARVLARYFDGERDYRTLRLVRHARRG